MSVRRCLLPLSPFFSRRGVSVRSALATFPSFSSSSSSGSSSVLDNYVHLVNSSQLHYDEHQYKIIKTLNKVQEGIHTSNLMSSSSFSSSSTVSSPPSSQEESDATKTPRGVYIYGEVGTGKTMMMDLFLQSTNANKKRVHFHKFMLDVHRIIHNYKQELLAKYGRDKNLNMDPSRDPILHCAGVIRESAQLLCFDEFQVTDIADAIIMTKLFGELWRQGMILVATSNRPPSSLYQGGLNREYFLPFIDELEYRCISRNIKSTTDYRMLLSNRHPDAYLTPVNEATSKELFAMYLADTSTGAESSTVHIPVMMGREIAVEARGRVCFVSFKDICEGNRGAADYSALARHMDIVYLEGIPVLSVLVHDKARRFITFVDEIYDAGKMLKWTSEKDPMELFQFLAPSQMKGADFGTDHSWANLEAVRGESGEQLVHRMPTSKSSGRGEFKYEKDGAAVSMRFQDASQSTEVSFQENESDEQNEIKLLEGELASIQELSFAFKRAASRLTEMSSDSYVPTEAIKESS